MSRTYFKKLVRINSKKLEKLKKIAKIEKTSIARVLDNILENYG